MNWYKRQAKSTIIFLLVVIITFIYYALTTTLGGTTFGITLNNNPDLERGLVAHWTFDGPDMDNGVEDRSGSGNNGTLSGFSATTSVSGKIGQALEFGSGDGISIGNSGTLTITDNTMTVSGWLKMYGTNPVGHFFRKGQSGAGGYTMTFNNAPCSATQLKVTKFGIIDMCFDHGVSDNDWHHYTILFNSSGTFLFVDGEQVDNDGNSSNIISSNQTATFGLAGEMDDMRVYDRALSQEEISRLYELGAATKIAKTLTNPARADGLVGHWTFDGPDMLQNVADKSGQGNHGNLQGQISTTSVMGVLGQALEFDGVDDTINLGTSAFDLGSADTTFSVWFKNSNTDADIDAFISNATTAGVWWHFGLHSSHEVRFNDDQSGDGVQGVSSSGTYNDGEWHHAVFVLDASGTRGRIFVDGVLDGQNDSLASVNLNRDSANIGSYRNQAHWYDGELDDIRVYDRALSIEEITRLYEAGR